MLTGYKLSVCREN